MARIDIERLTHDGRGLGRLNGKVAFVAGALPGETVQAALRKRHRRFDEYRLIAVEAASPERIEPRCPLVGRCGGCDLQHLAAPAQLRCKTDILLDTLRRQRAPLPDELVDPLHSVPFGYRRRARLAVVVPRRGGAPRVGFREAAGNAVVAVDRCPVLAAPLAALPGSLQSLLGSLQRPQDVGHLALSVSEAADGTCQAVVHVHAVAAPGTLDRGALEDFGRSNDVYVSLAVRGAASVYLHRPRPEPPGYLLPEFDLRLAYQPGDFLQGNGDVNRLLVSRVVEWLGPADGRRLLDAFAGVGNFSLALARRGSAVSGLEADARMVAQAGRNARVNGLADVGFAVRDLATASLTLDADAFDVAVLDPPRTGAAALVEALVRRRVPTLLYVSCAPSTFARDAATLAAAGYRLSRLSLVDMFPQTGHIESMALFTRT